MSVSYGGDSITFADGSVNSSGFIGHRNRIINGAMVVDQRNAGASVTPTTDNTYTLDRCITALSQSSKFSVQQNADSVTPPAGFNNYLGVTSLSAYSVLAGDYFAIQQRIEGFNTLDLGWGAAGASTVTLSFWVRSSLTGTFGGCLANSAFNRSYPFSYTISSANTWEQKTITITGDTSGTWLKTNGIGIRVNFALGYGATYGNGTAGAWVGSDLESVTGAVSVVGTSGATFYITGVQLERGSTASSFEYRSYGAELALCQRYYEVINSDTNQQTFWADINAGNSVTANANLFYRVTKRATPTVAQYGTFNLSNTNSPTLIAGDNQMSLYYQTSGTSRAYWYPGLNAGVTISAEL